MDEEAAALQKAREEAEKPPFLALGTQGAQFIYYARRSELLFHWSPRDHTPLNMRFLAPVEWWEQTLDPDGKLTIRQVMDRAIDYCINATGNRKFDPDAIRKCGVWDEDGAAVYHAGNAVYLFCPENAQKRPFLPVDHARTGKPLYLPGKPLLAPSDDILTDEEGKTVAAFIGAHSWKRKEDAFLCLGLVTQAILSGYLHFRAHGWINAPAGTGKTTLRKSIELLIGGVARYFKGLETTDAGLRQKLESDSCPVIFDEADSDNPAKTANMVRILALLRTATDGDVGITKGGADGKSVTYLMRNAFLLFSVRSMIEKASEQSRIFELELEKKDPAEAAPIFRKHDELAAVIRAGDLGRNYVPHHAPCAGHPAQHRSIEEIPVQPGRGRPPRGNVLHRLHRRALCHQHRRLDAPGHAGMRRHGLRERLRPCAGRRRGTLPGMASGVFSAHDGEPHPQGVHQRGVRRGSFGRFHRSGTLRLVRPEGGGREEMRLLCRHQEEPKDRGDIQGFGMGGGEREKGSPEREGNGRAAFPPQHPN